MEERKNGKSHLGIDNVTKRIKLMVNGAVDIESRRGEGTRVTIRIPKRIGRVKEGRVPDENTCSR